MDMGQHKLTVVGEPVSRPTEAQLEWLARGLQQPGGKLPLFDRWGQRVNEQTVLLAPNEGEKVRSRLQRAELLHQGGRTSEALGECDKLLKEYPQAKYVRSSARKARLVCDHIRGKSVEDARAILATAPRAIARDWSKLLESAVANAEHNHELVGEDLYVKAVHADEGPTIKRFRPRAMGRATRIRKRTSHLTILLTPKD